MIELLVVISIIALLIGLLLPVLGRVRGMARQTVEFSAARQLMVVHEVWAAEHKGTLFNTTDYTPDVVVRNDRGDILWNPATGTGLAGSFAGYPWRLAPLLNYEIRGSMLVVSLKRTE